MLRPSRRDCQNNNSVQVDPASARAHVSLGRNPFGNGATLPEGTRDTGDQNA
jgi:hypothetical protein